MSLIVTYELCILCILLLFRLYVRKYVNNLVIHPPKSTFAKFTANFSCNLRGFWPWMSRSNLCESWFSYGWTRFHKIEKSLPKKLNDWSPKILIFSLFKSFPTLFAPSTGQKCWSIKVNWYKLLKIV